MYYKFKPEDAFDFARYVGEPARQHGDELKFTRFCPYCHGGDKKDKNTFSINLSTGQEIEDTRQADCSKRAGSCLLGKQKNIC